jgi:hypothetical protein
MAVEAEYPDDPVVRFLIHAKGLPSGMNPTGGIYLDALLARRYNQLTGRTENPT